jgi:glucosamine--fructose-6-phosphate aminotransferase (isomerizing)
VQVADIAGIAERLQESLSERPPSAPRKPVLVGMGASFAALGAAEHVLRQHKLGALRVVASTFDRVTFDFSDLVVALSQSGKSKETIEAVQAASGQSLAVVNNPRSPLAGVASGVLSFGPVSDSLASTTGYTGSLVAMGMLVDCWVIGRPGSEWRSLGDRLADFQRESEGLVADLAGELSGFGCVDVVGSGGYWGAAEAGALLLREVCGVPTAAFTGRQYLHGPMEAHHGVGHLIIGATDARLVSVPLADSGRPVIVLSAADVLADGHENVRCVRLPAASVTEEYIFAGILLQHVAARLAVERSADPDEFIFLSDDTKVDVAEPCSL